MSFQVEYNGLTIDNQNGIIIESITGLSAVEVRTSEDMLTGTDGGAIWEQFYGMRNISITGTIIGSSVSDYFEKKGELTRAFSIQSTIMNLYVTTWAGERKMIPARVINLPEIPEVSGEVTIGRFFLSLRCPSPFFEDEESSTATIQLSATGGYPVGQWDTDLDTFVATSGMPVSSPIPYSADTTDINNTGDAIINPVYVISGPVLNPSIRNTSTGKFFTVNTDLLATETITVQLINGVLDVRKNGVNLIGNFTGQFPCLALGNNTLRFTASTFQAGAKVDVTYRKTFLSL